MDVVHAKLKCGGVWQLKICLLSEADSCIQQKPLVSGPLGSVEMASELSFSMSLFLYLDLIWLQNLNVPQDSRSFLRAVPKGLHDSVNQLKGDPKLEVWHSLGCGEYLGLQLYHNAYNQGKVAQLQMSESFTKFQVWVHLNWLLFSACNTALSCT